MIKFHGQINPTKGRGEWDAIKKYFINFTNHPYDRWEEKQKEAAREYGEIIDIPFPQVSPQGDERYIDALAERYVRQILALYPRVVLCQGESCLAYQVITKLHEKGILVLAACSERIVREVGHKKEVSFIFEQFRKYGSA